MLNLKLLLFSSILAASCGTSHTADTITTRPSPQGGSADVVVACPVGSPVGAICSSPAQNSTCVGCQVPIVVSTTGTIGANPSVPDSYTFLDTPNANLCLDAFIRNGTPVPATATAKTLNINNHDSTGIFSDTYTTLTPVVTIISANSCSSTMMLQLLNKNGFYCIVGINNWNSDVTIQRSCAAIVASIEPQSSNNAPAPVVEPAGWFWWLPHVEKKSSTSAFYGSFSNQGSNIKEVPCIP